MKVKLFSVLSAVALSFSFNVNANDAQKMTDMMMDDMAEMGMLDNMSDADLMLMEQASDQLFGSLGKKLKKGLSKAKDIAKKGAQMVKKGVQTAKKGLNVIESVTGIKVMDVAIKALIPVAAKQTGVSVDKIEAAIAAAKSPPKDLAGILDLVKAMKAKPALAAPAAAPAA